MSILTNILEALYLLIILLMTAQAIFNIRLRLFIWESPPMPAWKTPPTLTTQAMDSRYLHLPRGRASECL